MFVSQVVFSVSQLSWLSTEQAWAVTEEQWAELDTEQRNAVQRARYEGDILLGLRGALRGKQQPCFFFFFKSIITAFFRQICTFNLLLCNDFQHVHVFSCGYVIRTNRCCVYGDQALMHALLFLSPREKLGSLQPERSRLHRALLGSVPPAVAAPLKCCNQFNVPMYRHICTSATIKN